MDEAMREIMLKRWEFAAACGDEVNKAIPLYGYCRLCRKCTWRSWWPSSSCSRR